MIINLNIETRKNFTVVERKWSVRKEYQKKNKLLTVNMIVTQLLKILTFLLLHSVEHEHKREQL